MKLQTVQFASIVGLLLPLAAVAAPAPEPAVEEAAAALGDYHGSSNGGLDKRSSVRCEIVNSNSDKVNCRSGPGFDYADIGSVTTGHNYPFSCYKSGDCYEGNCTWQRVPIEGGGSCYVNGYYTDSKCTVEALGKC